MLDKPLGNRIGQLVLVGLLGLLRVRYPLQNFRLPLSAYFAVAGAGCQHIVMPEVLALCLEFFWRFTGGFTQPNKCVSKAVRVEIKKSGISKRFFEYFANR